MKLIIAGASGFVASEVVRQSVRLKEITSVIALARKPIAPSGLSDEESAKLRSVVTESYETYSPEVQREFASADACIWCAAPNLLLNFENPKLMQAGQDRRYHPNCSETPRVCRGETCLSGLYSRWAPSHDAGGAGEAVSFPLHEW